MAVTKVVQVQPPAEVDLVNLGEFVELIEKALDEEPDVLVIDFASVEFMSGDGIGVLAYARGRLTQRGGRLLVVNAPAHIQRLLEALGFDE